MISEKSYIRLHLTSWGSSECLIQSWAKTPARKKGTRAEAESLLGVLIKLNYDRI